jgi:hypothetical protein
MLIAENDYVLEDESDGLWITVGTVAVRIDRIPGDLVQGQGVRVTLYRDGHACAPPLAMCEASDDE